MKYEDSDYVSFETAKLLKEKGFPQTGHCYEYEANGQCAFNNGMPVDYHYECPPIDLAAKWLWVNKHYFVSVNPINIINKETRKSETGYQYRILDKFGDEIDNSKKKVYFTAEMAKETAVVSILINLINC